MDSPPPVGIISAGSYTCRPRADRESIYHVAATAAERAMAQAGVAAHQLSDVVVASATPGHPRPATAATVQRLIGAHHAAALDVHLVYGFGQALALAERILRDEPASAYAVVIGTEVCSPAPHDPDPAMAVEFSEEARAVVLGRVPAGQGIIHPPTSGQSRQIRSAAMSR